MQNSQCVTLVLVISAVGLLMMVLLFINSLISSTNHIQLQIINQLHNVIILSVRIIIKKSMGFSMG